MISGIGMINPQSVTGGASGAAGLFPSFGTPAAGTGLESSFAAMLSSAAGRTVGALQNAEQMSVQALSGDADTREVVDAVMNAEQSLQAAVAIRDKIVTAYLEISRMQI